MDVEINSQLWRQGPLPTTKKVNAFSRWNRRVRFFSANSGAERFIEITRPQNHRVGLRSLVGRIAAHPVIPSKPWE